MSTQDDLSDATTPTLLSTPVWQPLSQAKHPLGAKLAQPQASVHPQATGFARHSHIPSTAAMQPSRQEVSYKPANLQVNTFSVQTPHASCSEKHSLKADLPSGLVQSPVN